MHDQLVSEFFKWLSWLFGLSALASACLFMFEIRETPNFRQHVNYQIERHGGLTEAALNNISVYSEEQYGGRYEIESTQLNEKVSFGEMVDYTVVGTYEIRFVPGINPIVDRTNGRGQSLVR